MATFFKTPFNISSESYYIEAKVSKVESSSSNIICCVDVSGSMSGSPIRNVCQILRDIYKRTQIDYSLFTYNTSADTTKTIRSIENHDLNAGGGTSFSSIFTAVQNHLVRNQKSTTFIFMTDGDDTDSQDKLKKSIQMLKLTLSGLPKTMTVIFHVIGFGNVNKDFLEQVRTFGNKEGLFRYSTESAELQNNFNDMFEYAMSAREFTLILNGKSYASNSNEETVAFLIDDKKIDESITNEIILKSPEGETKMALEKLENTRPIHIVRALNLISPDDADSVNKIRNYMNTILPIGSANFNEKLEVEQIKKEIDERMMEYTKLFTQIKMGQVPEQVQLKLNALRHDATFANIKRRKILELRVNKNVDYFRRTDISGILDGYKAGIDQQGWKAIKDQGGDWVCTYSQDDICQMMRKTSDNVMCLGILIERNEEAITHPTKGLKLLSVSNTLITYDAFIAAMNLARNSQQEENYGNFNQINDQFCIIGQAREKINAVIPLYINYEHMKRIRILEGIWLGYLYTLDSYGYDKEQEIGLLKLLYDIIMLRNETSRNKQIIAELKKVCQFIVSESIGFKTAYGENTYKNFVSSIQGRQNSAYDLNIPLMVGYFKDDLKNVLIPVYYEHIRRSLQGRSSINRNDTIETLLYGDENERAKAVAVKSGSSFVQTEHDPDFVEKSFIDFFHDEMKKTIELIPETVTGEDRKQIKKQANAEFIRQLLKDLNLSVPMVIKDMLKYAEIDEFYVENHLDYDDLRKELLIILFYDRGVPQIATKENILSSIDKKLQGNRDNLVTFNFTPETIRTITYAMLNAKTLEGFAGLLRKYCPKRCNQVFTELIKNLLITSDINDDIKNSLNREKLVSLLTNRVGNTILYNNEMAKFCWQPLHDVDIDILEKIVGKDELKKIEQENLGKLVVHCYRTSNISNSNGYGNYNPCMHYLFTFTGYRDRH